MNSDDEYLALIRDFAAVCQADPTQLDPSGEITLQFDGLVAAIYPDTERQALVIDIDIFRLQNPQGDPANLERLLMLHRLNSLTRFTHGGIASVCGDDMLTLSRSIGVRTLDGQELAAVLTELVDAATQLADAWTDMRQLIQSTAESLGVQAMPSVSAPGAGPITFA